MMRGLSSFGIFLAVVVETALSKPLWPALINTNYLYPTLGIGAQPQHLASYQNPHFPYYVYNIYSNVGGIPSTLHGSSKPELSHFPPYNVHYGTPIYDIRIPLNPVYPVLTPSHPEIPPLLPPTSTDSFDEDDYDDIETLADPDKETTKLEVNEEDESITVEAI